MLGPKFRVAQEDPKSALSNDRHPGSQQRPSAGRATVDDVNPALP